LLNIFNNKKKIGILGGTFDPPHLGHLHISKIALNKLKLDSVIWIITKQNPLKEKPYFSLKARIKMSKSMIQKEKNIFADYLDDVIKSTNTFKLLKFLKKKTTAKLFFLMGADNLVNFHKWKKWEKILDFAKIVVFPRSNFSKKTSNNKVLKEIKKKNLIYIKSKKINISSTSMRKFKKT